MRRVFAAGLIVAAALLQACSEGKEPELTFTFDEMIDGVIEVHAAKAPECAPDRAAYAQTKTRDLEAAKVERRDMQTSQLNLAPVYEPFREGAEAPPKVVAFQASNMVTVVVRDLGSLGGLVDALAGAGANRLYGIAFDVAEPRPSVDAARREAVADARAKAELYAEAAGVTLGPVVTIRESVGMGGPEPLRAKAAMEAAPVAEGTVTLTADVEVVFGIE